MNPENNDKQANTLCLLSMACVFIPTLITILFTSVWDALLETNIQDTPAGDLAGNIWSIIGTVLFIAGIAILIYVRIKYPQNTFGKVLMWVYIALAIILIILFIALIVFCYSTIMACGGSCDSCIDACRTLE